MSDLTEAYEYYKKTWERQLAEATSELREENARLREALSLADDLATHPFLYSEAALRDTSLKARWDNFHNAREALKGTE